jgi:nitrate/nitrite-specific signal transduction histidine kinase
MRNHRSALIVLAVLLIAFATVVISSTLSSNNGDAAHTMPDGGSMKGDSMP